MKRTEIKSVFENIGSFDGKEVTVAGWIRTIRDSKKFGFIEINDGTYFKNTQIVFEDGVVDNYKEIAKLNVGSAIYVTGKIVATPETAV